MEKIIKWFLKFFISGIFWVFILSVNVNGRTVYSYASDILIENDITRAIDREIADLYYRFKIAANSKIDDTTREFERQ